VSENLFGITHTHEMSKPVIVVGGNNDQVNVQIFGCGRYLYRRHAKTKLPRCKLRLGKGLSEREEQIQPTLRRRTDQDLQTGAAVHHAAVSEDGRRRDVARPLAG
jgi:hypothetical protein